MKHLCILLVSLALLSGCNAIGKKLGKEIVEEESEQLLKKGAKEATEEGVEKGAKGLVREGVENVTKQDLKEGILGKAGSSVTKTLSTKAKQIISYRHLPKGRWSGERGNSFWLPDNLNAIPKRNGYSNPSKKTWKQILEEYNCKKGIPFKNGEPDFKAAGLVKAEINIGDIGRYLKPKGSGVEREYLHTEAFKLLAEKWHKPYQWVKSYKENNNLVWHELTDGHTLVLVPREIHDHINHAGGVAMWKAAKGL